MSAIPSFASVPRGKPLNIVLADGTAKKLLFTPGASGSKITALNCTNPGALNTVALYYRNTTTGLDTLINTASVAATAGSSGSIFPVSLLDNISALPTDNDGQRYFFVEAGDFLYAAVSIAMTGTNAMGISLVGGDF